MKKRLLAIFSVIMIATIVTVMATGGEVLTPIIETIETEENTFTADDKIETVPIDVQEISIVAVGEGLKKEMDIIMQRMEENGAYYDEIKSALNKYIDLNADYSLDNNEKTTLLNLSCKDYDFEKVLDVFNFIKLTDLDETDLEAMYLLAEKSNMDESIENAYAIYTNRVDDELTVSDVAYYVDQGISIDEILHTYELTLTGDKRIKTVLDEFLAGKSPGEIIAESYGLESDLFGLEADFSQVLTVRTVSRKTKQPMHKIAVVDNQGKLTLDETTMQEYTQNRINVLKEKSELGTFNNLDLLIENDLHNVSGISFEEANQLAKQGYRVRDIEQAVQKDLIKTDGKNVRIATAKQEGRK